MAPRPFPPARPHGELTEALPGIYVVIGTLAFPGPVPIYFSRNMTVVKEGERLVLINAVRLDDRGLAALDALGKVTDVIRVAGFHGMDDPFYHDRYRAKVWAIAGQRYADGFDAKPKDDDFTADNTIDANTALPIAGARIHLFDSTPPEGLLILERHRGTIICGDCLQNWGSGDAYCNWPGRVIMRLMGLMGHYNVGPGWLKYAKPSAGTLRALLGYDFENVFPHHGTPVIGGAKEKFRPSIERAAASLRK